ncbi:hypothetical protein BSK65_10675 [Paenibacillus odorifer]|uniref:Transglutaminase-like domain-containing protein n=2 Tax=Paenibacillus odorifer TaxID=189426 RepID=A0A1R0ZJZ6_9BACL|nr:hypothetical protein BSK65_10675 [Paenibacillus odorifer]
MFAVPLLQTLKAAGIIYTVEGKNYVFTYQQTTYKIAFDGTSKMSVIYNGKSNDSMKSGTYEAQVVDGELYVNARVIQTIFYHADPLTASLDQQMRKENTYVPYDTEALHERERFLNLYTYDPYANKQQSNAALKKVMENIPPDYYVESRLPEDEKAIIKQKAQEITSGITSDFDKLKAIHQGVAKTIAYDMDLFNNDFTYVRGKILKGKPAAYHTLQLESGICESYAELTNQLLKVSGIPARVISADAEHAWTQAYVNGRWIDIDPTWDASDAIVKGQRVANYFSNVAKVYFDFDQVTRYDLALFRYNSDDNNFGDNIDPTLYTNWYWNVYDKKLTGSTGQSNWNRYEASCNYPCFHCSNAYSIEGDNQR